LINIQSINIIKRISIYSLILLFAYLSIFFYFSAMDATSAVKTPAPEGIDFSVYYTAGNMALNGQAADLYNYDLFHYELEKVLKREIPQLLGWIYPPSYLSMIVLFAIIPYYISLDLWILLTLSLAIYSSYLLLPKYKQIGLLVCGFPGVLMNLRWGQNAFLNTALLGFGLYFFDRKPILAGLMFGLLTYKPQMAFFPLLLILITKNWKVLIWSGIFALANIIISAIIFGITIWYNFLDTFLSSMNSQLYIMWEEISAVQPTIYSFLRILGVEDLIIQIILGIIAIIVTIVSAWVWRKTDRLALKGTVMVLGILLTMPYYMQYDLMILSIPLILLFYDFMEHGYRPYEIAILMSLWFMPLVNWPLVILTKIQICPFILFAVLAMAVIRTKKAFVGKTSTLLQRETVSN